MKRSLDRILTTHVGSLIRPPELRAMLKAEAQGDAVDAAEFEVLLTRSVADIVKTQAETGIDVVSDGEFGKNIIWSQYVLERLSGFERRPLADTDVDPFAKGEDRARFPEFYAELDAHDRAISGGAGGYRKSESVCVGPIEYTGQAALQRDIDNIKAALVYKGLDFSIVFAEEEELKKPPKQQKKKMTREERTAALKAKEEAAKKRAQSVDMTMNYSRFAQQIVKEEFVEARRP